MQEKEADSLTPKIIAQDEEADILVGKIFLK